MTENFPAQNNVKPKEYFGQEITKNTSSEHRKATPENVKRLLRQEAGFGCARCGHPYLEYHHIIPYEEDYHFRSEDMVCLCRNCHSALGKKGRDLQYKIKENPYNIKKGIMNGALDYDKRDLVFKVGGIQFINTPTILQFRDIPIISCVLKEGQVKVSLNLLDQNGVIIFSVKENDIIFRTDDIWDFKYAHNLVVVRRRLGEIALRMDFRKSEAFIHGHLWIANQKLKLYPKKIILPGNNIIRGGVMSSNKVGICIR